MQLNLPHGTKKFRRKDKKNKEEKLKNRYAEEKGSGQESVESFLREVLS